jgi:cell division protein FtsA
MREPRRLQGEQAHAAEPRRGAGDLSSDEKELGCLLVDLGGGTTDVLVYSDGAPYFSSVMTVGGSQVTNDLSIMLSVSMDAAERLKRESASAWLESVESDETVIVPSVGGRAPAETPRRRLCSIVQPRMEEVFGMVRERVEKMGHWKHIKGGVVLTGGGALMQGAAELAQEMFQMPVGSATRSRWAASSRNTAARSTRPP